MAMPISKRVNEFRQERFGAEPGSRLLVTLNVSKNPYTQINYGTGKDVSDENINDAKIPLQIK